MYILFYISCYKVGPGEYAYTDDSPFGIPPMD